MKHNSNEFFTLLCLKQISAHSSSAEPTLILHMIYVGNYTTLIV